MKRLVISIVAALAMATYVHAQQVTISGFISDSTSCEPLISAVAKCGMDGTVTNDYGFYAMRSSVGEVSIEYSYVGFKSKTVHFRAFRDTAINVSLSPDATLHGATVTANSESGINSTHMGVNDIPIHQIRNTPAVLGESDVLKTIQLMPGVQHGTSGFTGLYVRGGGADENLLMLDGVAVYNAGHLLGLFSIFMPEAVKKVTFYRGAFPARYGSRVSSVVDVRTNDGNMEELHGSVSVGVLSSKLHLEGPLSKGRTSYSVSARLMHSIFAQPIIATSDMDDKYNYWFYDMNAKVTHSIGYHDKLYFSFYNGKDHLLYRGSEDEHSSSLSGTYDSMDDGKSDVRWGNTIASVRWGHVYGGRLFSNATVAYNRYRMRTDATDDRTVTYEDGTVTKDKTKADYDSGIDDMDAAMDFEYMPNRSHSIRFGGGYIFHRFSPESYGTSEKIRDGDVVTTDTTYRQTGGSVLYGHEISAYVEDEISVSDELSLNPGLRVTTFLVSGKAHISLEPRFSVRYGLGDGLAFKAAYSRMSQNVHLLSSSQISLPMDLWVPVTKEIKPILSDQCGAGVYYDGLEGWEMSLEGYYKKLSNVLEYKDGVTLLGNSSDWQHKVVMGEGRSRGVELLVQKTSGRMTGWVAYTLAKTERRFPDGSISQGEWFPYRYDRRNSVNVVLNYKLSKRIDVCCTWTYATGGVITLPVRQTVAIDPDGKTQTQTDLVTKRGNYRLPASHMLNLSVNFRKQKKHGERVWNIGVYNLYNHHNPDIVEINTSTTYRGNGSYSTDGGYLKITSLLPIIPSFSYTFNF